MTEAQRKKFHRLCNELDAVEAASNLGSYNNMVDWLRRDHYSFYLEVKNILYELWEEIKSTVSEIGEAAAAFGEGFLKGSATLTVTPVVAVVEGVKEGFKNGLDAGIDKAISESKKFLKDLWG